MNGRTNSTSTGEELIQIPLDPVETFVTSAYNGYVEITWDDPVDKYATPEGEVAQDPQQLVSKWSYTTIVKKEGSDPTGPKDGIPVVNSNIRDQYKSTPFTDTNVVNNTEYHYAAFAINEDEVSSDGVYQIAIPKAYSLVLAENTWEQINDVANEGIAASVWDIGDTKDVLVSNMKLYPSVIEDVTIPFAIIGFDVMDKADGTGKAPITFIAMTVTEDLFGVNAFHSDYTYFYESNLFDHLYNTFITQLPSELANTIPEVVAHIGVATGEKKPSSPSINATWEDYQYNCKTFGFVGREVVGDSWIDQGLQSMMPELDSQIGYPQFPYFATSSNRNNYNYYGYYMNPSAGPEDFGWCMSMSIKNFYDDIVHYLTLVKNQTKLSGYGYNSSNDPYNFFRPGFCVGKSSV